MFRKHTRRAAKAAFAISFGVALLIGLAACGGSGGGGSTGGTKSVTLSYAGYPECQTRITCILGMKQIYGIKNIKFIPIGNISVYTLLDQHKALGGDGFSTDPEQLQKNKYTALVDNKHIFGFQNVAPVLKASLLSGADGALLASTANAVSSKLTLAAMQAMNKAYVVNKAQPQEIAHGFLAANKLLTGGKKASGSAPKIVLGTKNFGEEYILGQLYGQALQAKGFNVEFKGSFGSSELADKAITSGKMNFYPEYTGVVALDLAKASPAPKSAAATYSAAKKFEQGRGLTMLNPTPFADTDTFTVLTSTATKYGLKTMSDLTTLGK
ncbi:MAG TPA: glycine betaine ABC transporter substrate-binding protein [Gaiellaceae bacterium]|nr:glycine betaine ABC transporter substrate-binding protein [Gaiellaceae bacterium]